MEPSNRPEPRTDSLEQIAGLLPGQLGLVVVDHGSRLDASNRLLLDLATVLRGELGLPNIQPAHMEIAEPTVEEAFDRCVAGGARLVVVFPYFLLPGRHWTEDIPRLAAAAAGRHPGVRVLVAEPLGLHPLMTELIRVRVVQCLGHAS